MPPPKYPVCGQFVTDALLVFVAVAVILILWLVLNGNPAYHAPGTPD